jgi:hypothetical protein
MLTNNLQAALNCARPSLHLTSLAFRRPTWLALTAVAQVLLVSPAAQAIEVVTVEEHWELRTGAPDAASSSPQVSMLISPHADIQSDYFVFTLNHRNHPNFAPGGMQVQRWYGEQLAAAKSSNQESPLTQSQETITWVQRLDLAGGTLSFKVLSGTSTSWGAFGGPGDLVVSTASNLTNLNNYRPMISLQESGVSFAGNRVQSLTLTKLRWIDADGEQYELEAPIDVDTDLDP